MGNWETGLFGCFRNVYVSLVTYIVPCYVAGKNAEEVGYSCKTLGLLFFVPFVGFYYNSVMRRRIRARKGIAGTKVKDCCAHTFCTHCALIQDAQELTWWQKEPADQRLHRQ